MRKVRGDQCAKSEETRWRQGHVPRTPAPGAAKKNAAHGAAGASPRKSSTASMATSPLALLLTWPLTVYFALTSLGLAELPTEREV